MSNKIELIIEENQLDTKEKANIMSGFDGYEVIAREWEKKAKEIKVTSIEDKEQIALAKEGRKLLKEKRVEIEKNRKAMKETALRKGQAIDAVARFLTSLIKPIEDYLYEQEKYAEIQEAKRLDELEATRKEKLAKYVSDVELFKVREMEDEAFDKLLESQKRAWEIEQEEIRKAEEDRIAREKAEQEKAERLNKLQFLTNNIQMWNLDIEVDTNTYLELDSKTFEAKYKELSDKVTSAVQEVKAEKEKLEAERKKLEAEREKERKAHEAKLEQERQKRLQLEAEQKAKEEAERKRIEEEEKAKKAAQSAPDKQKLKVLASNLLDIEYPELQTEEAKKVLAGVKELMQKVNVYIVTNIDKL